MVCCNSSVFLFATVPSAVWLLAPLLLLLLGTLSAAAALALSLSCLISCFCSARSRLMAMYLRLMS